MFKCELVNALVALRNTEQEGFEKDWWLTNFLIVHQLSLLNVILEIMLTFMLIVVSNN